MSESKVAQVLQRLRRIQEAFETAAREVYRLRDANEEPWLVGLLLPELAPRPLRATLRTELDRRIKELEELLEAERMGMPVCPNCLASILGPDGWCPECECQANNQEAESR